jgi:hypothetical protein
MRGTSNQLVSRSLIRLAWTEATTTTHRRLLSSTTTPIAGPAIVLAQTSAATALASKNATYRSWSWWYTRLAKVARIVRIPLVVVSLYTLGYQQGIVDCTKEPFTMERQLLHGILRATTGGDVESDTQMVEGHAAASWWHYGGGEDADTTRRYHRVAAIGHTIVAAAREHVQTQLAEARENVRLRYSVVVTNHEQLEALYEKDEAVEFWKAASVRIDGEVKQPGPENGGNKKLSLPSWQYVFIDTATPNAFVTELLPRRFFITTALLELAGHTNPHEVAVILAHEMAHLVLGHLSSANQMELRLRTAEVLLLSLDPTAGFLSMGIIYLLRQLLSAAHSRHNEWQADELGLQLAAAACFDTVQGCNIMAKLHQLQQQQVQQQLDLSPSSRLFTQVASVGGLMDSHPPSLERLERLRHLAATTHNRTHHAKCRTVSHRLYRALWGP